MNIVYAIINVLLLGASFWIFLKWKYFYLAIDHCLRGVPHLIRWILMPVGAATGFLLPHLLLLGYTYFSFAAIEGAGLAYFVFMFVMPCFLMVGIGTAFAPAYKRRVCLALSALPPFLILVPFVYAGSGVIAALSISGA